MCEKCDHPTEKSYFEHLNKHLKNHETISCIYDGCSFTTNIYGTFKSHRSRKHASGGLDDFQNDVIIRTPIAAANSQIVPSEHSESYSQVGPSEYEESNTYLASSSSQTLPVGSSETSDDETLPQDIEQSFAAVLLKLESILHVSANAITELAKELELVLSTVSAPIIKNIIDNTLQKHNCDVDEAITKELADSLCKNHPLSSAVREGGPLSTDYRRKKYFDAKFSVVKPVEYILDRKEKHSFQYVPLLQILRQVLAGKDVLDKVLDTFDDGISQINDNVYKTFRDGLHFKSSSTLCDETFQIAVSLYVDDFEVCNPLGTSKHKICAVYWMLSDLPSMFRSSLTSINLALLCMSDHVKEYGYGKIFEPLLKDLITLEETGIFISKLGVNVKGFVQCVAADNLGAHALAGFVESFSAHYVCRVCTGLHSDFQTKEVRSCFFKLRTKEDHALHVQTAQVAQTNCFGVKQDCVLTANLHNFNVLTGYPPDILHDFFEGVVPVELARCLRALISKGYFTLSDINDSIIDFPYKWLDKKDRPHRIAKKFASTIGGNAHENWTLLRLLPFMIGAKVPVGDPVWEIVLILKDIVEIVVASFYREETIDYLECKISEHRERLQDAFPDLKLRPKHHFIEHYPHLIRCFGPLVYVWTMRYEAKHSFFKQVARYTNCFKNILLSLAVKHQYMMAYHLGTSGTIKSALFVCNVSTVPVEVLNDDWQRAIKQKYPNLEYVQLTKTASYYGTEYSKGMILGHGSTAGLPDFIQVSQIIILQGKLIFIGKILTSWYNEHFRSYEVSCTRSVVLVGVEELADFYPLAAYKVDGKFMVSLKRFIDCKFW